MCYEGRAVVIASERGETARAWRYHTFTANYYPHLSVYNATQYLGSINFIKRAENRLRF